MLRRVLDNLMRNWVVALPTILAMAMVLTLLHGLLLIHQKAQATIQNIQQKFSITVYLKDGADPFEIGNLITALEDRTDVNKPVIYTSKEAAWKLMSATFSLDEELLKKYKFSLPASLNITPKNPSATPRIEAYLETHAKNLLRDPLVSREKQKNITEQMIEFIQNIQQSTLRSIFFFIALFIVGGALLVGTTIHLAISFRHREIAIMQLVGAGKRAIVTPFLLEGLLLGIMAFVLHTLFLILLPVAGASLTRWHLNLLLLELIATLVLSGLTSYIATVFHIRKKSIFTW